MPVELNSLQQVGVSLMIVGLVLNNGLIIYFYFKIIAVLKENNIKPGVFPPLTFYVKFKLLSTTVFNRKKRKEFQKIRTFMRWSMIVTVMIMILGTLLAFA